jgi:hypothetical protein
MKIYEGSAVAPKGLVEIINGDAADALGAACLLSQVRQLTVFASLAATRGLLLKLFLQQKLTRSLSETRLWEGTICDHGDSRSCVPSQRNGRSINGRSM